MRKIKQNKSAADVEAEFASKVQNFVPERWSCDRVERPPEDFLIFEISNTALTCTDIMSEGLSNVAQKATLRCKNCKNGHLKNDCNHYE